jgi:hypothetical protein
MPVNSPFMIDDSVPDRLGEVVKIPKELQFFSERTSSEALA